MAIRVPGPLRKVEYADGGLYVNTAGERLGTLPRISSCMRSVAAAVRESLQRKIPNACGSRHELSIARRYKTRVELFQALQSKELQRTCLCPHAVRCANPNCAHADDHTVSPAPYEEDIGLLIGARLLDPRSWQTWFDQMQRNIAYLDTGFSTQRYTAGPSDVKRQREMQMPNIRSLEAARQVMLSAVGDIAQEEFLPPHHPFRIYLKEGGANYNDVDALMREAA